MGVLRGKLSLCRGRLHAIALRLEGFFFSSRRRHTRFKCDWSSDVCSSDLQYFQALMGMDIIMTPQTQASELLALPDLYHELAHFVLFRRRSEFEVPLLGLIHRYFVDAIRKGRQQGLPETSLEIIRDNHALWMGSWHVEFACDLVVTYWCGP